jgi:hypothetical protein
MQQIAGNLFDPRRDRVGVLRAQGVERPQHHQVKRPLQNAGFLPT